MAIERLGPYRIERTLGRGGMGTVYSGVNEQVGQRAAVKVLSSLLAANDAFRERFEAEIETLKTLKHPNIVQLYGYGEQDGHLFYAMELIEGTNLEEELQNGRRFQWREVTHIGIDVCRALKHAHDCGVIHRDLKPANLLINQDEKVKLTDFGIAKLFGHSQFTAEGGVLGTADYMSPEQAQGLPVTPRSDLYSLGSVMYALLAGRPPFRGKALTDVLHMLRYNEPVPVRTYAPDVPAALERIITQLLDKNPQKRIPTALALSNVLQATEHALSLDQDDKDDKGEPSDPSSSTGKIVTPGNQNLAGPSTEQHASSQTRENQKQVDPSQPTSLDNQPGQTLPAPGKGDPPTFAKTPTDDQTDSLETTNHFTKVDAQDLGHRDEMLQTSGEASTFWLKFSIGAVIVLTLLPFIYLVMRPPSPDRLYASIHSVAEENDIVLLSNREDQVREFVERFPDDPRCDEVKDWLERIDIHLEQTKWEFRTRQLVSLESLSPVQRAYLDATQDRRTNPELTVLRLQALIDVFGDPPDSSPQDQGYLQLARRQLEQFRRTIERASGHQLEALEERIKFADGLRKSNPRRAEAIWRGIVDLYGDKPWASEAVASAKRYLAGEEPGGDVPDGSISGD